jgi:hypothetical protein
LDAEALITLKVASSQIESSFPASTIAVGTRLSTIWSVTAALQGAIGLPVKVSVTLPAAKSAMLGV